MKQGPGRWAEAYQQTIRRTAEILIAACALLLVSPLMIIIAIVVRATSPGPALFKQRRVGLNRQQFCCYKFRTMTVGGDDTALRELIARQLRGEGTPSKGSFKLDDDSRITPVGSFLRRTSLDELPQLFNVLDGTMSLVGPRPMLDWQCTMFPAEFSDRFAVPPGITGLWQVSGRSKVDTLDMLRLDVDYVRTRTLYGDFVILLRTIPVVLFGHGAR
jgi:lipopolysaccharide/colanic/teichoic acid biosynthesis glycosyltransferase